MRLRVLKGSVLTSTPVEADDVTYVVCYNDEGAPLVVVEQAGQDVVQVTHAGERMFTSVLRRLGVTTGVAV
jgi:hypothetical protein